jgi:hypothetical protein
VNEFEIEVDGQKVFRGFARKAPEEVGSFTTKVRDWSTAVIFGGSDDFVQQYARQINYDQSKRQNVMLMNERKVMNTNKSIPKKPEEKQRPETKVGKVKK